MRKGVGPPLLHWRCWGPIWFDPPCALLGGFPLNGISPRHNAIEHYALAFPSIMHGRKGGREGWAVSAPPHALTVGDCPLALCREMRGGAVWYGIPVLCSLQNVADYQKLPQNVTNTPQNGTAQNVTNAPENTTNTAQNVWPM
ncbi:MAG: hypothetical protein GY820_34810 [Gammaproteobacteria bacterium]|nr:hypothetical protein [Gammaproteobacteria bacterium]